jgi:hypothetical protein
MITSYIPERRGVDGNGRPADVPSDIIPSPLCIWIMAISSESELADNHNRFLSEIVGKVQVMNGRRCPPNRSW